MVLWTVVFEPGSMCASFLKTCVLVETHQEPIPTQQPETLCRGTRALGHCAALPPPATGFGLFQATREDTPVGRNKRTETHCGPKADA